jgi:inhibitor of cysteine peptidase
MARIELWATQPEAAVELRAGDELVVRLPERPTGHQWEVTEVLGPVTVTGEELEPPGTAAPGAAAQRRVTVRADEPGTATVDLGLRRPWEEQPARRTLVRVTVRPAL